MRRGLAVSLVLLAVIILGYVFWVAAWEDFERMRVTPTSSVSSSTTTSTVPPPPLDTLLSNSVVRSGDGVGDPALDDLWSRLAVLPGDVVRPYADRLEELFRAEDGNWSEGFVHEWVFSVWPYRPRADAPVLDAEWYLFGSVNTSFGYALNVLVAPRGETAVVVIHAYPADADEYISRLYDIALYGSALFADDDMWNPLTFRGNWLNIMAWKPVNDFYNERPPTIHYAVWRASVDADSYLESSVGGRVWRLRISRVYIVGEEVILGYDTDWLRDGWLPQNDAMGFMGAQDYVFWLAGMGPAYNLAVRIADPSAASDNTEYAERLYDAVSNAWSWHCMDNSEPYKKGGRTASPFFYYVVDECGLCYDLATASADVLTAVGFPGVSYYAMKEHMIAGVVWPSSLGEAPTWRDVPLGKLVRFVTWFDIDGDGVNDTFIATADSYGLDSDYLTRQYYDFMRGNYSDMYYAELLVMKWPYSVRRADGAGTKDMEWPYVEYARDPAMSPDIYSNMTAVGYTLNISTAPYDYHPALTPPWTPKLRNWVDEAREKREPWLSRLFRSWYMSVCLPPEQAAQIILDLDPNNITTDPYIITQTYSEKCTQNYTYWKTVTQIILDTSPTPNNLKQTINTTTKTITPVIQTWKQAET